MIHFCKCRNYIDDPIYRLPYDIYFGSEKDLNENFDNNRQVICEVDGIDSFLYLEQDKNINDEIIISKRYSIFWKDQIYTFLDNILNGDKNILFLYYNNREYKKIYKIKIYDINNFNVNYKSEGKEVTFLKLELKISNFKQSYKFINDKNTK